LLNSQITNITRAIKDIAAEIRGFNIVENKTINAAIIAKTPS